MSDKPKPETRKAAPKERGDRLKSALKANLARRKAQMRARAAGEAGHTEAGHGEEQKD
ncbi:hypothetical protein [Roseovarius nitratireducens]|jgi:hypothetical protein|uniref:hypothetical protein n=1 Tax=Roseovarius nitratireducens TaxID=2044597 RepID=UPI0013E9CFC6|nr:hypothetical protein [Roseovarius nitratireducens]|tara:strand:+ start:464 stop:637 length:174 start_codon:yes stop_codon:yes gene_type:complete